MKRLARLLLPIGLLLPGFAAADCGNTLDARTRRVVAHPRQPLAFAPVPTAPLAVGRHFGLDIEVCPRAAATMPFALRLEADMPEHRHGMNYKPTVRAMGDGRWRADGLMLHMPGRWRFVFELSADGRLERLTHEFDLR